METQTIDACTVMFADVAGSTKLYETLGDTKANSIISELIDLMQVATRSNHGIVIKTIGDEVMCRFNSSDDAANTAIQIQEKLQLGIVQGAFIAIRIGFHTGPAILQDDGDVFGDSVNTAARMAGIAKGRQIILSQSTAKQLSKQLSNKTRDFDKVHVKGKAEELFISELVWENAGVTQIVSIDSLLEQLKQEIILTCNGENVALNTESEGIQLGRSDECDLTVFAELASRFHAKIGVKRGNFVLIDQSTNGTYVQTEDGNISYLRRDEMVLKGKGLISLGSQISTVHNPWQISFDIN
jgi:adenylate cyclase